MKWVEPTCRMCEIDDAITAGANVKTKRAIKKTAARLIVFFGGFANAEKIVLQDGSTINGEVDQSRCCVNAASSFARSPETGESVGRSVIAIFDLQ